jgi:hypothetical protein
MSDSFNHDFVLPAGSSCRSYRIGHNTHWIQGVRSAGAAVVIRVSVVAHASGLVELRGDGLSLDCWSHTPTGIQESLMPGDPGYTVVWWVPEWHVLSFSAHGGGKCSLAELDHQTPCVSGADLTRLPQTATALDRARRGAGNSAATPCTSTACRPPSRRRNGLPSPDFVETSTEWTVEH